LRGLARAAPEHAQENVDEIIVALEKSGQLTAPSRAFGTPARHGQSTVWAKSSVRGGYM